MGILSPVILGFVIAFLLNPIVKKTENLLKPLMKKVFKKEEISHKFSRAIGIFVALVVLMDLEAFMGNIYQMDLIDYGKTILYWYLAFVGAYGVISFIVYSIRYRNARKQLKLYFNNLKILSELYENNEPKGKSNE